MVQSWIQTQQPIVLSLLVIFPTLYKKKFIDNLCPYYLASIILTTLFYPYMCISASFFLKHLKVIFVTV